MLLLIAIACLWGGGQGIYTAYENQVPTVYDINDLTGDNMPKEKWLTLNNCHINLTESVYFESAFGNGLATELYTPLNTNNDSISVFLVQKTKGAVDVFNLINTQTDPTKTNHFVEKYQHLIFKENMVYTGLVRYGIDLDSKEWRQLANTSPKLVNDFIILDYNTAPNNKFSYTMFIIGLVVLIVAAKKMTAKKQSNQ
jgi:hypothetical protein